MGRSLGRKNAALPHGAGRATARVHTQLNWSFNFELEELRLKEEGGGVPALAADGGKGVELPLREMICL